MANDVIHTAIWVTDMNEVREFFVDALGLQENWSFTADGVENVYIGGENAEIQFRRDTENPEYGRDIDPNRTDFDHVAVTVDDADAECERMVEETDCTVVEGPMTVDPANARVAFLEGPDGYVVELVEDLG